MKSSQLLITVAGNVNKKNFVAQAQAFSELWNNVKSKLGFGKTKSTPTENTENIRQEETHEPPSMPKQSPLEEIWKPGYRGRTDNKRF